MRAKLTKERGYLTKISKISYFTFNHAKASAVIKGLRPFFMHIKQTDYICALTRFLVPTLSANGFDLTARKPDSECVEPLRFIAALDKHSWIQ